MSASASADEEPEEGEAEVSAIAHTLLSRHSRAAELMGPAQGDALVAAKRIGWAGPVPAPQGDETEVAALFRAIDTAVSAHGSTAAPTASWLEGVGFHTTAAAQIATALCNRGRGTVARAVFVRDLMVAVWDCVGLAGCMTVREQAFERARYPRARGW